MLHTHKFLTSTIAAIGLIVGAAATAEAKSWTCNTALSYGDHSYTPAPWSMSSGGLFPDREAACKRHIEDTWLNDDSVLSLLGVTHVERTALCASGGIASVRADYGFDKRKKSWQFSASVAADCVPPPDVCSIINLVGNMTSETSAEGTVTRSGVYDSSYEAWQVFDVSDDSMWISAVWETPAWLQYEFYSGPKIITEYALTFVNGSLTTRAPKDWTLEGWDGIAWHTVDSRTNEVNWAGRERRSYTVTDPGLFSQYRLNIMDDNDSRSGVVVVSLGRVELIGSTCD